MTGPEDASYGGASQSVPDEKCPQVNWDGALPGNESGGSYESSPVVCSGPWCPGVYSGVYPNGFSGAFPGCYPEAQGGWGGSSDGLQNAYYGVDGVSPYAGYGGASGPQVPDCSCNCGTAGMYDGINVRDQQSACGAAASGVPQAQSEEISFEGSVPASESGIKNGYEEIEDAANVAKCYGGEATFGYQAHSGADRN